MTSLRNKIILALVLIGVVLFMVIQIVIIPENEAQSEQYQLAQQSPLTHDLESILPYKNKYMGATSNLVMFNHLPLDQLKRTFQLRPEKFTIEIHYEDKTTDVEAKLFKQAMLYNSVSAFALVDNLQTIEYRFSDTTIVATRVAIQGLFGEDLASLLTKEKWRAGVQDKLRDDQFVEEGMKKIVSI
ncbi:DUF4825 domain-containing protein [Brevibacillus formosus]|uniref:DUF4825 domain-containing protein n=1 Tax=Brevibacillus formosus TaxID=54913 RepID=A0A837KGN4_9BACL|nr:DUF4825 domain-containing protein [Brevibacillus formosus]KLH96897.1 hypothetical protein AA984_23105 [Brevibacillus formosus]MED1955327.1 DUF4825 domain-containing protein [Brevibacillus formosus]PSJ97035.1 DUF4825 domain-containing protein [Brevibacillus formosus]